MEQQQIYKYPDIVNTAWECAKACKACSVRSKEQDLDCWKHCDITYQICQAVANVFIGGESKQMEGAMNSLMDSMVKACQVCDDMCQHHKNPHCQNCSNMCRKTLEVGKSWSRKNMK